MRILGEDFIKYFEPYGKVEIFKPSEKETDFYGLIPKDCIIIIRGK